MTYWQKIYLKTTVFLPVLVLFLYSNPVNCQKLVKRYYNKKGVICSPAEAYTYLKVPAPPHRPKSGKIFGYFVADDSLCDVIPYYEYDVHGQAVEYWENGNAKRIINYYTGYKDGEYRKYYADGNIMEIGHYIEKKETLKNIFYRKERVGSDYIIDYFWNPEGKLILNKGTGKVYYLNEYFNTYVSGSFYKAKKSGWWKYYDNNSVEIAKEYYDTNGVMKKGYLIDQKDGKVEYEKHYIEAEPLLDDYNWRRNIEIYLKKHCDFKNSTKYSGSMIVQFRVNKVGELDDVKFYSGNSNLMVLATEALKKASKWKPAEYLGKKVDSYFYYEVYPY